MKDHDYAPASSECALAQRVKLLNILQMKMSVFLGLPTISNNLRIL